MTTADPRIDTYIADTPDFARPILEHVRARMWAAVPEAAETIKWNMPFFTLNARPFANMAAFKAHASFGFWQGMEREAEGMGQFGRLTAVTDLPPDAEFDALLREAAIRHGAERGKRPRGGAKPEATVPPALATALANDPLAAKTFAAFPPSCRREYCEWIADAKREATRATRVAQTLVWLRDGKRRNWKYESC